MMKLMLITNNVNIAKEAEEAGVDRIFVDLEINGKYERQGHLDTHIGNHKMEDVGIIKRVLRDSEVLVRINPYYSGTQHEVNECINQGADIIMLPMFKKRDEVEQFIKFIDGRARVCLLLETAQALVRVNEIVDLDGIDEIHIGLNDLHLSLGLDFMFEVLGGGIVDYLAKIIKLNRIKFGFGGIARIGEGDIPSEMILSEHYRLGSQMAILSRTFHKNYKYSEHFNMKEEIRKIRNYEKYLSEQDDLFFQERSIAVKKLIRKHVVNSNR